MIIITQPIGRNINHTIWFNIKNLRARFKHIIKRRK